MKIESVIIVSVLYLIGSVADTGPILRKKYFVYNKDLYTF